MSPALQDGLYKVEISGFGHASAGVVVLNGARLLGGDSSHYFSGALAEEGGQVRVEIHVARHSQEASPAFGPLASANLVLVGQHSPGSPRLILLGAAEEIRALAIRVCLTPLMVDAAEGQAPLSGAR